MTGILDSITFRNGAQAKNRTALAAMTNGQSHEDGTLSADELRWLELRAKGGFGIVTTCAAHVSKDGQGWPGELGIYGEQHVDGLRRLADALFSHGALPMVQLYHGGLRADSKVSGSQAWSASEGSDSDVLTNVHGNVIFPKAREGTLGDIQNVIADFAAAAQRASDAGMAGVEIHGAHGYLLTQFLSRIDNRRSDEWGGSLENRARLMREVTRAVRAAVPDAFVVGMRLSPEDGASSRGLDLDENLQLARWLCEDGIDFLHLSVRDYTKNTTKYPQRHALRLFRDAIPKDIPLLAAGQIWTREDAERALDLGADIVALAKAAIVNPDWPRLVGNSGLQPARPPVSARQLREWGLNDVFIERLRASRGEAFVKG